ncbi:hypothetical protein FACS1894111_00090 [Clostridia bacterium]|nr:hypothetical protein FACS1894111_00090 [Clostridia bacterium]
MNKKKIVLFVIATAIYVGLSLLFQAIILRMIFIVVYCIALRVIWAFKR